jgi:hypothetical protein
MTALGEIGDLDIAFSKIGALRGVETYLGSVA